MTDKTDTSPLAARSRRYRQRRRKGTVVLRVEVDVETLASLVRYGVLDQRDIHDRDKVGGAVSVILDGVSKDAVAFDAGWLLSKPCASRVAAQMAVAVVRHP